MEIIEDSVAGHHVFRLVGRLDSNTSPDFEKKVFAAIDAGAVRLIVDCEKLDYITSAGLRVLNKTSRRLKAEKGTIVLCAMEDYVREVFEIAGFDTFLPIVTTFAQALEKN